MNLVLASTSRYRRRLLARLGVSFDSVAPAVDEDDLKVEAERRGLSPRDTAEFIAVGKAESVARISPPDAVVIGGDQLVALDDEILGKPETEANAVEQLARMAGRAHELITSMAVCHRGKTRLVTDVTVLTIRKLSRDELAKYVAADQPLDCAGSYRIESRGIALFERIDTRDPSAIEGLPLLALTTILRELGVPVFG